MAQRVRIPHRGQGPSSVTQLPILTALHARFPTLFGLIIHHLTENVNRIFINDCLPYYDAPPAHSFPRGEAVTALR